MPRPKKDQTTESVADAIDPAASLLDHVEIDPTDAPTDVPATPDLAVIPDSEGTLDEPSISDPNWTNYVLSLLTEEEQVNGRPKVPGLRRLTYLVGELLENTSDVIQVPNVNNGFMATVKATVVIQWTKEVPNNTDVRKVFTGLADVSDINTNPAFARFATSTAETRAEGRALKKALNIQVTTAEEMTDISADSFKNGEITPTEKNFIDLKCRQNGIDVLKFIASYKGQYKTVESIPSSIAKTMIKHLSELQQNRERIPDRIKGYDPNWNDK